MVPYLKERGRTNGWYVAKKAGKHVQDKRLLTETSSAEKGEEEDTWRCFFSFGFVAVVPNTKLAKRSRYLSKNSLRQLDDSQLFRALVSMHPLSQYTRVS